MQGERRARLVRQLVGADGGHGAVGVAGKRPQKCGAVPSSGQLRGDAVELRDGGVEGGLGGKPAVQCRVLCAEPRALPGYVKLLFDMRCTDVQMLIR